MTSQAAGFAAQRADLDPISGPDRVMFEETGALDPNSWNLGPCERAKHEQTLALLPRARYASALEVGASNGALGRLLAPRCDRYLGIEANRRAIDIARRDVLPSMAFRFCVVPDRFPNGPFDLILLSDVLSFLGREDLERLARQAAVASPLGDIVCVNYLGPTGRELGGAQAARIFSAALGARPQQVFATGNYRVDVFPARLPVPAYARTSVDGVCAAAHDAARTPDFARP